LLAAAVSNAYPSEKVSPKVLASFKSEFSNATDVQWETGSNYFRASFIMNEQNVFAYYDLEGHLLSIARYISSFQLPVNLFSNLKNNYDTYWISDLFEVSNSEGLHYYVTLETADTKLVLRSSNGGDWSQYNKSKKI
jgi:predicted dehydrogenase